MAVPSSGALGLYSDIGVELGVPQSNVSLGAMSDSAGFAAPDAMSDFYGYVDAIAPSVTTNSISSVTGTTLTLNGNATSDGGSSITQRGFYFGTNSSSPTNNTKYTVSGTTGAYSLGRTGLSGSTTYYCWAFATNSIGTTYGSRTQATTSAVFTPTYSVDMINRQAGWGYTPQGYGSGPNGTLTGLSSYIDPYTSSVVTFYSFTTSVTPTSSGSWQWYNMPSGANRRKFTTNATNLYRVSLTSTANFYGSMTPQVLTGDYSIDNKSWIFDRNMRQGGSQTTNSQFYIAGLTNGGFVYSSYFTQISFTLT